ncbi:MAG: AAA family ATPase [Acidobacteria bacterium]|nr:AAA family ATPase [Acidobacteriota bacterium]
MIPADWSRIKHLVAEALARPIIERQHYLETQTSDEDVRREAASLLAAAEAATDLYTDPAVLVSGARSFVDALTDGAFADRAQDPVVVEASGPRPQREFRGTGRYAVRRLIGAGGMGVVYEVEDRLRRQPVALKVLHRADGAALLQFKREFRSLADLAHPNLVSLYDLVVDDERCFFTMELVEGVSVDVHVRGAGAPDHTRARHVFGQLVRAVEELHRHGTLHGDVKPSNVLVTPEGRVVLVDFGLASRPGPDRERHEGGVAGTPAYVSPEQCLGAVATQASDWYGVGATLYHALTGHAPFEGPVFDVLRRKIAAMPPAVLTVAPGAPQDLSDVCMALLETDPTARITGSDALARLGLGNTDPRAATPTAPPFVGRASELAMLSRAFDQAATGCPVLVCVHGPAGIGKSALLQHFFDSTAALRDAIVLRSRCHAHESVAYKGLDGLVDSLSRHIRTVPLADHAARALARLFPVFRNVDDVPADDDTDPVMLQQQAFAALRDLLSRLTARAPVVAAIDDFHWADADSAAILTTLLRPPAPPPFLLLLAFRTDEVDAKPFLRALIDPVDPVQKAVITLAPMTADECARMIDAHARSAGVSADERDRIAREAAGNPYLVEELTRAIGAGRAARGRPGLGAMLQQRLSALPPGCRPFVETLAVCGRPMPAARVFEACGLTGDERPLVARLCATHFLRTSRSSDHVELYHDRIRETLLGATSPAAVRAIHARVANVLLAHGDDEPEALFDHWRGAGELSAAAACAAAAATRAGQVLAFDRAASFFRSALELQPDASDRTAWRIGLARSLEHAGRPAEAAEAYLEAATETSGIQQVEWKRKGAEQLLMGGHIDRGLAIIDSVLPAVGLRQPRGPRAAVGLLLLRRARLAWRGLEFEPRDPNAVTRAELLRIDTCWAISTGLMLVDTLRAASFHVGHLRLALDTGEPYRVARALALEACFSAASGSRAGMARSEAFAQRARRLADRLHHPHVIALSWLTAGIARFVRSDWTTATDLCERALTLLRQQGTGAVWESTLAQNFFLGALMFRGQIRRVTTWLPDLLRSARERGNLYFEVEISARMSLAWLAKDRPDEGERQADEAIARWSAAGFYRQHYNHVIARVQAALYRGDAERAWHTVTASHAAIRRSLWLHVQYMRVEFTFIHARCAIAMAAEGRDVRSMLATAERASRVLAREGTDWAGAAALVVRAAAANLEGDERAAADRLQAAIDLFDRADMQLYAAAGRRRLAALAPSQRGRTLRQQSDRYMADEDIRNPLAMARLLVPGFRDLPG